MLALLLLAADPGGTAVDAENAFRRAAQAEGQWTAFRKFATGDAIVFTPQPEKAQQVLPTKNPPIAVQWWPAESYVSCDGTTAVNTGPWIRPRGTGYFTTVWHRQSDGGWKWSLDHGDDLARPRPLPERPPIRQAKCPAPASIPVHEPCPDDRKCGHGRSPDGTLHWDWEVLADGSRSFYAELWDGRNWAAVISNKVAAPK